MRAFASDLPVAFESVNVIARSVTILKDLNLNLNAGAPTMLVGPNGSGKTTFLRLAMGMIAPARGRVTYGGRTGVAPVRRAIVFQRPVMLRRTAMANIRYALASAGVPRTEWKTRAESLLDLVGLASLADRPARRMSGGEQQRIALARALARDPEILFLDEPTASLDPAGTKAIEDIIGAVSARGIKVVMSTHDLAEARRVGGEIILLHRGQMIEKADTKSFFDAPRTAEARSFIQGDILLYRNQRNGD
jgi:tungstate transport system ATP-binding protein